MSQTKRLSELKVGDHIWWEGEICKIENLRFGASGSWGTWFYLRLPGWSESEPFKDDEFAVPTREEVAEMYGFRAARRKAWEETRPAYEAKCMAKARSVALALGKEPEVAEKQMRALLDAEREAFEEEFGEGGEV